MHTTNKRKAKEEAARKFSQEKKAKGILQSAKYEIDQWQAQQWQQWESAASQHKPTNNTRLGIKPPSEVNEIKQDKQQQSTPHQTKSWLQKERLPKLPPKRKQRELRRRKVPRRRNAWKGWRQKRRSGHWPS